ncbi:MAG: alpha/beta fold hydrolase [Candidatus Omnitrophota bacterium]
MKLLRTVAFVCLILFVSASAFAEKHLPEKERVNPPSTIAIPVKPPPKPSPVPISVTSRTKQEIKKPLPEFKLNSVFKLKNSKIQVLAGKKEPYTSVYINNREVIPNNGFTSWYYEYPLTKNNTKITLAMSYSAQKQASVTLLDLSKDAILLDISSPKITNISIDPPSKDILLNIQGSPGILSYNIYYADSLSLTTAAVPFILAQSNYPASGTGITIWRDNGTYTSAHPSQCKMRFYRFEIARVDVLPPTAPSITDEGIWTQSTSSLIARWTKSTAATGIAAYAYKVTQDSPQGMLIKDWTEVTGEITEATILDLNLASGKTYYFAVKAKSGAGIWSEPGFSDGITVDTEAPVTEASGIDGLWHNQAVTVTLNSSDSVSGVDKIYYSLDGSSPSIEYKGPVVVGPEGEYTLRYYAIDKVGNKETVKSAGKKILIDTTPPVGTLFIENGNSFSRSREVGLNIVTSESSCQLRLSNNSSSWDFAQPYSPALNWALPLVDGSKIVYAQLIDKAGNYSQVFSSSIILDQAPPVKPTIDTSTVSYEPSYVLGGTKEAGASILLSGNEVIAVDQNQRWAYTVRELQPGANTFTITSKDLAGNESASINFTVTYVPTTAVIQAQIDQAKAGDTVYVNPGTYKGNIYLRAGISLAGKNALDTIIMGNNYGDGIIKAEEGTEISGLMISAEHITSRNSPNGIYYCGKSGGSIRISHNIIKGNISRGSGIRIDNVGNAVILDNLITTFSYSGIDLRNCGTVEIINNTLTGNLDNGIFYLPSSSGVCRIINNIIAGNLGFGIFQPSGAEPQKISFNDFWGNLKGAYYFAGQANYPRDSTNISAEPLFTGGYYLNPVSPCINAGQDTAYIADLARRTTNIDGSPDDGNTDLGFHYFSAIAENKDFQLYPTIFLHGMGAKPEDLVNLMDKVKLGNMQTVCPVYAGDELGKLTYPKGTLFSAGYYKENKNNPGPNDYTGRIGGCPVAKGSADYDSRVSYAAQLKRIVENVCLATGSDKVNIVAHSMGGLIARAYIRWLGGDDKINKLLLIGVPNHGIPEMESFLLYVSGYQVFSGPSWMANGEISELNQSDSSWGGRPYIQWMNEGDETYKKVQYATIAGNYNPLPAGHSDGLIDTGNVNFPFAKFNGVTFAAHSDEMAGGELSLVSCTYTLEVIKRWLFQNKIEKNARLLTYGSNPSPIMPYPNPFGTRQLLEYEIANSEAVCLQVLMTDVTGNLVDIFAYPAFSGVHGIVRDFKDNSIGGGAYIYNIRAYDMEGIIGAPVTVKVMRLPGAADPIPLLPDTSITDAVIINNQADFSYASDTGTEFSYKLDNGSWSAWSREKVYSAKSLKKGAHIFWVKSRIPLYYDDPTPASYVFTIEN